MSAGTNAAPDPVEDIPERRPDELALSCIYCQGAVGRQENVVYWPPGQGRPGVIAHKRCHSQGAAS